MAGAGAASTRESITLAKEAAAAGADFVMVIPPGYYASTLIANRESIKSFFVDIAAASPVPIIVYNFPGVSSGIDLDSDIIIDIVKASPNVAGAKLTCASVGKITRVTAVVDDPNIQTMYPRKWDVGEGSQWDFFQVIDGYIDILLPSVASGAAGAISGLPNFAPVGSLSLKIEKLTDCFVESLRQAVGPGVFAFSLWLEGLSRSATPPESCRPNRWIRAENWLFGDEIYFEPLLWIWQDASSAIDANIRSKRSRNFGKPLVFGNHGRGEEIV